MSSNRICELVCTRISHDIVGNVGAVANAVELLEEDDMDFMDDIKSILKVSSQTLTARMKFFRLAFGLGNANLANINIVKQIAQDYLLTLGNKDFPIKLSMSEITEPKRRWALLAIMAMADILIRGGELKLYELNELLYCEIASDTKISPDKLNKMIEVLALKAEPNDAGTAPLWALLEQTQGHNIEVVKDNECVKLVVR